MSTALLGDESLPINPLDVIFEHFQSAEWSCQYDTAEGTLHSSIPSEYGEYTISFVWDAETQILRFFAFSCVCVPPGKKTCTYELLALINQDAHIGSFGLAGEGYLQIRVDIPLRGVISGVTCEQLEDLVEGCVHEMNRFHPAFNFAWWGGMSSEEALKLTLVHVEGNA